MDSDGPGRLASLLRLLQLASPSLMLGAYTYSEGLEYAVAARWVGDEATAADWILGQLEHVLPCLDVPVLARPMADRGLGSPAPCTKLSTHACFGPNV